MAPWWCFEECDVTWRDAWCQCGPGSRQREAGPGERLGPGWARHLPSLSSLLLLLVFGLQSVSVPPHTHNPRRREESDQTDDDSKGQLWRQALSIVLHHSNVKSWSKLNLVNLRFSGDKNIIRWNFVWSFNYHTRKGAKRSKPRVMNPHIAGPRASFVINEPVKCKYVVHINNNKKILQFYGVANFTDIFTSDLKSSKSCVFLV